VAYKLIDPQKGMCQSIHYPFTTKKHVDVALNSSRDPKLGILLSQNFGHSYLSQIKFVLKMRGQYLIALKKIFLAMYSKPQSDFI
jgi:hypothetical protein